MSGDCFFSPFNFLINNQLGFVFYQTLDQFCSVKYRGSGGRFWFLLLMCKCVRMCARLCLQETENERQDKADRAAEMRTQMSVDGILFKVCQTRNQLFITVD